MHFEFQVFSKDGEVTVARDQTTSQAASSIKQDYSCVETGIISVHYIVTEM